MHNLLIMTFCLIIALSLNELLTKLLIFYITNKSKRGSFLYQLFLVFISLFEIVAWVAQTG